MKIKSIKSAMDKALTPKRVARAIGVSEATLKRWCDRGLLPMTRTPGGHRRLEVQGVMEFLRKTEHPLPRPDLLGLPSAVGKGRPTIERASETIRSALEEGDEEKTVRLVIDLYLAGRSAAEILDVALTPAFHEIGCRWEKGDLAVYRERRGCEIALRILGRLRALLPPIPEGAPQAFGGTLEGDPYSLATAMVEIALREAGWRADSFGVGIPTSTWIEAIDGERPRLFWLSISSVASEEDLIAASADLYRVASERGTAFILGGRGLGEGLRRRIQYSVFCDDLAHLVAFARTLWSPGETSPGGAAG